MTGAQDYRSFADPDTHFIILTSDSPVTVDGYAAGEPYGLVACAECRAVALDSDWIPHHPRCSQADVRSRRYARVH